MKSIAFLSIFIIALTAQSAVESTLVLKPAKGDVLIEAVGRPAMVKIKGKGEGPTGALKVTGSNVTGEVSFALDSLDTGIDLRNEHMKEKYLETKKHPKAILTLKEVTLPAGWSKENPQVSDAKFKGELLLHGEKKSVEGTFEVTSDKELKAKMEIKISDFKIDIPSYLGITVADTVKIQISAKELF